MGSFKYINEIKRESKRCKKIVQDLLSYARTPRPTLEKTDVNMLLEQIVDFAADVAGWRRRNECLRATPRVHRRKGRGQARRPPRL